MEALFALFLLVSSFIRAANAFAPTRTAHNFVSTSIKYRNLRPLWAQASGTYSKGSKTEQSQLAEKQEANRRQLLGMPKAAAADQTTEKWKILLQLMKPITWVPLAAGVMCGAAASGNYHWIWNPLDPNDRDIVLGLQDATKGLATMILAGPFMEGYSQTINDWYDKDIDVINEPYRPIPSGAISEQDVKTQIFILVLGSLALAYGIDNWSGHEFPAVLACAAMGTLVGYIYSAPPLRLKHNGWLGDLAIGLCYITLPWWGGHAAFGHLDRPTFWLLPMLCSISGIGPAIANDFKSYKGDKEFGIQSIPVMYGIDTAKWICAAAQTLPQLAVSAYLVSIGEPFYAVGLLALLLPQFYFIKTLLLPDPMANDVKFQASCQPFFFLGLVLTSLCIGNHDWGTL